MDFLFSVRINVAEFFVACVRSPLKFLRLSMAERHFYSNELIMVRHLQSIVLEMNSKQNAMK